MFNFKIKESSHVNLRMRAPKGHLGFALMVVIFIVAIVSVTAIVLLDYVNIDINLVGQQRQFLEAQDLAQGGLFEVLGDEQYFLNNLPGFESVDTNGIALNYQYAHDGIIDPAGAQIPMSETTSLFFKSGAQGDSRYDADVCLLRVGSEAGSSIGLFKTLTYEVSINGQVNGNDASAWTIAQITQSRGVPRGWIPPRQNCN